MGKGENIGALLGFIQNSGRAHIKVQTAWVMVTSVDWDKKTMVAEGVADELPYNDILLGLGNYYRKPVLGSLCLIGLIENNDAASFLLEAEDVEESIATVGKSILTTKPTGFEIARDGETLKAVLEDFIQELQNVIVVQGTSPNIPALEAIKQRMKTILI